ncbi:S-layer homology domain-containing protein [Paenibacillus hemerocallicola]|uniref:S-layer homology domain-containing protein n=1 Tax=Paenibacillus hemerocallicola TaxID=1172614 RepID=A0A5C4TE00_9BACL|nr:S-layer homology domain-containing protein [Paenibacillus hemerocallicola]TNJ67072.1 S-layer homology domain-containing protein [Paenibacillus hemerocallicola]
MRKRLTIAMAAVLALLMMLGGSVYAFTDTTGDPNEAQIAALQKAGIVNGVTEQIFAPKGTVTMAQAVAMLVKAFDLNIDHIRFIKEPKASDTFTNVPDDAWYAKSFLYASLNGVPIPKDADPMQKLTKEQYADLLFHALIAKGDYAFVKMYVVLKDEQEVTKAYMNSIQNLLLGKMTELDNGYFYPKKEITRSEAARMLHAAIQFSKQHEPLPKPPAQQADIKLNVTKVNDEVNKVTLVWADRPNPGYGISVSAIEFGEDGNAVITYVLHEPDPNKFYPQVISEAKVDTFIASSYTPVLNNPK